MSKVEVNTVDVQCGSNLTVGSSGKTITAPGNDIRSNAYKASDGGNIVSQSGTTITLGASGDTISLACGASQSGFGRTGTVDWCTTAKTSPFTAVNGNGYFVNTTGGGVTVTLPSSPSAGDIIAISDYANKFSTNNLTIGRNSSKINGGCYCTAVATTGASITLIYVDATRGWKQVNDATLNISGAPNFILATGGTEVTCGDYKTHIFTSDGNFAVASAPTPGNNTVDYFVVAGGGSNTIPYSGGGGAGGFRVSNSFSLPVKSPLANPSSFAVSAQTYPVTVGGGGSAPAGSGSASIFSSITSAGGGFGASNQTGTTDGADGGSGGSGRTGGCGNTPPVSPPQGNNGGTSPSAINAQGGGGGAGGAGGNGGPANTDAGGGGAGSYLGDAFVGPTAPSYGEAGPVSNSRYFAGGGGGGSDVTYPSNRAGVGGGGDGRPPAPAANKAGKANTGGGAGGTPGGNFNGGSGIVMIRYKFQ